MIAAAIFDLDGVIVRSDRYHYQAWKQLADEEGWNFDEELNHQLRGVSRLASLQIILDHNQAAPTAAEKERCAERKNGYYRSLLAHISHEDLLPGALEAIRAFRLGGLRTAVASGSKNAAFILEQLAITDLFDALVTGHDVQRPKPDPQLFLLAAERLGIEPARCVVFEDAPAGIAAAIHGGMDSIGVGSVAQLREARRVIADFRDLDSLLADLLPTSNSGGD